MRKLVYLTILFFALVAFKAQVNISKATADQEQGLFLFVKSRPDNPYKTLGTVKAPAFVASNKFETILDLLIKRVKNDYPDANALIFRDFEADAIKIEE